MKRQRMDWWSSAMIQSSMQESAAASGDQLSAELALNT
jgi:hypothetical protein